MKLIQSFLLGIIGALGALVVEVLFSLPYESVPISLKTIAVFAIIEELFKAVLIYRITAGESAVKWFALKSLALGMGFGLAESLFALAKNQDLNYFLTWPIFSIHMLSALAIGLILTRRRFNQPKIVLFWALLGGLILHLSYNYYQFSF